MRRLFANGNKEDYSEAELYERSMSNILRRSALSNPPPKIQVEDKNNRKHKQRRMRDDFSSPGLSLHSNSYSRNVLGVGSPPKKQKKHRDKDISINLSLKLRKPTVKPAARFIAKHRKPFVLASCLILVSVAGFGTYSLFTKETPAQVAGVSQIAPDKVYLPKPVPEGFSVGSSKEDLENGAVLYTVFGPHGETITLTQHASAPDFDQEMLKGGLEFITPHGTAYVLAGIDRITGYLLGEHSWVLLNSIDRLSPEDMRTLIRSLEPV